VRFVQKFLNELAFFVLTGGFAGKEEREAARALGVRLSLDEVLGDLANGQPAVFHHHSAPDPPGCGWEKIQTS
jgi:hypothetical protein